MCRRAALVKVSVKKGDGVKFAADSHQILLIKSLCRVSEWGETASRPSKTALAVVTGGEVYLHLEGLIDLKAEAAKQQKEREKLGKDIQSIQGKLANEQIVKNAPAELVEAEKAKAQEAKDKITRIENNLKSYKTKINEPTFKYPVAPPLGSASPERRRRFE